MQPGNQPESLRPHLPFAAFLFGVGLVMHLARLGYWSPLPDEINYGLTARYLIEHRTLVSHSIMFFPPLFVYLAALLQLVGAELLASVRVISAVSGALILPMLYLTLSGFYDRRASRLAAVAALPLFSLHLYSRLGQVEVLMLALLAAGIFALLRLALSGRSRNAFWSGLLFGCAVWVKETALGAVATGLLFLLVVKPRRGRDLALLLLGWLLPTVPLVMLGALTGQNLLLEVSASRGYDINMLKLPPLANLLATGGSLGYNLFPRLFYPWEFALFAIAAPPTLLILGWLLLRAATLRHPVPLLVICYLAVHLPFFFLFSRKFDYYLLPAALLLLTSGVAESGAASPPIHRRGFADRVLRPVGLGLTVLLVLFNLYSCRFLYWNKGTHRSFETAVTGLEPGSGLVTSHPSLARYLSDRHRLNLRVASLFLAGGYDIDWSSVTDSVNRKIILKRYYVDVLAERPALRLDSLTSVYPEVRETFDLDWSVWFTHATRPDQGRSGRLIQRLRPVLKPVGVLVLAR